MKVVFGSNYCWMQQIFYVDSIDCYKLVWRHSLFISDVYNNIRKFCEILFRVDFKFD